MQPSLLLLLLKHLLKHALLDRGNDEAAVVTLVFAGRLVQGGLPLAYLLRDGERQQGRPRRRRRRIAVKRRRGGRRRRKGGRGLGPVGVRGGCVAML